MMTTVEQDQPLKLANGEGYRTFGGFSETPPPFRARPPWIGGDLQTLKNLFRYTAPDFSEYASDRFSVPMDDGTGDYLHAILNRPLGSTRPPIVLIHGLTGCEDSQNIRMSAAHHLAAGFPVLRLNLRGAGPGDGGSSEHYHAGRSQDLAVFLNGLPAELTRDGVFLVGVSLGGNMLLKYLSEDWERPPVIAAAAVSAPIWLKDSQERIHAPRNFVYHRYLLNSMKEFAKRNGAAADPAVTTDPALVRKFYEFDDRIVAPRFGFSGAGHYYEECSSRPRLPKIKTPTLLIHAADDPWIPLASYLNAPLRQAKNVSLVIPDSGGHVGFHASDSFWPWHDRVISRTFQAR